MGDNEAAGLFALFAGMGVFMIIFLIILGLAMHLFFGYCYKLIAEKTGNNGVAGFWWVPIVNMLLPVRVAGKPNSWFLLLLSPIILSFLSPFLVLATGSGGVAMILWIATILLGIASGVLWIIIWMRVAEARGQETWWGVIAAIIMVVGVPYLAFTESGSVVPAMNTGID